jgi:hypothetical protein
MIFFFKKTLITAHPDGLSFRWGFASLCPGFNCSVLEKVELFCYLGASLAVAVEIVRKRAFSQPACVLIGLALLFQLPLFFLHSNLAVRLSFASVWLAMMGAVFFFGQTPEPGRATRYNAAACLLVFSLAAPFVPGRAFYSAHPASAIFPQNTQRIDAWLPPDALVYTQQGMHYAVHYYLKRRSVPPGIESARSADAYILRPGNPKVCAEKNRTRPDSCLDAGPYWIIYQNVSR